MKGDRCDICELRDGHQNLTLIHCNKCELAVHKECYGMQSYTLKRFTCWACQAVGRSFEIEDRDELGNRRKILQKHRPTKCALCNVSEGIHAMHPLYDSAGSGGRQLCDNGELAWAHSLCAFILTIRSHLFGCARDGDYGAEDDAENDERSENSELMDTTQEGEEFANNTVPIHHFVYDPWKGSKQQQRFHMDTKKLRCSICGADDKPENILRLCAQCYANDTKEFKDFKGKHPSLGNDETCTQPLHVGCARWGGSNPSGVQRVFFFPGDIDRDPVANLFCSLHASDVEYKKKKNPAEERKQAEQQKPPPTKTVPRNNHDSVKNAMVKDLIKTVAILEDKKKMQKMFEKRKKDWKERLKFFTEEQFANVWKIAKRDLKKHISEKGNSAPNHRRNSQDGSMQRVVSQSDQSRNFAILENQRRISQVIANRNQRAQAENGSPKKTNSVNDVASKPTGKQGGSKRRKVEQSVADDSDDGEEFEWEQNDDEADLQTVSAGKSANNTSGSFSFVSGLCHPLPRGCTCSRVELLEPREYKRPPARTNPIDKFGQWDL